MLSFAFRRLAQLLPVLLMISFVVFMLIHIVPGDPIAVLMGEGHSDPVIEAMIRTRLGLDQPIMVQYLRWLGLVLTGDLGTSIYSHEPILAMILARFPATLMLAFASAVIAIIISIPAGVISAIRRNTLADFASMGVALFGISIPNFWLGVMLILLFSQFLGLLPSMGYAPLTADPLDALAHLVLPALTLGAGMAANLTRLIRAEVLDELSQDYVRTAHAKGLSERVVIGLHVLKNALIPAVTVIGVQVAGLLEGAVLTETIFAWPGIGRLAVSAVFERDYALVQGVVLFAALVQVSVNFAVDLTYRMLDPRVKLR
jgi:peptide/nickel transport system permease protein